MDHETGIINEPSQLADSDFQVLLDSFNNKKVNLEILQNCELMYVCKTCKTIFCKLEKYANHYKQCLTALKSRPLPSMPIPVNKIKREFNYDDEEEEELLPDYEDEGEFILPDKLDAQNYGIEIKEEPVDDDEDPSQIQNQSLLEPATSLNLNLNLDADINEAGYYVDIDEKHEDIIDSKNIMCLKCNKKFPKGRSLRLHLAIKHLGYHKFKCKFCDFKSNACKLCRKHALEVHQKDVTEGKFSVCFCRLSLRIPGVKKRKRRSCFNKAAKGSTGDETVVAAAAASTASRAHPITKEELEGVDLNSANCSFCGSVFSTKRSFRRHLAVFHLGGKTYRCKLCDFQGNLIRELLDHVNVAHKDKSGGKNIKKLIIRNSYYKF